jgi:catechol 2,3-dioxygenase-like lactoylglutathione lyase family enzyme
MEASVDFYTNLLGFEVKKDMIEKGDFMDSFLDIKDVEVRTVKMSLKDGGMIELLNFISHPRFNDSNYITRIGCTHIALTVKNIDSLYEEAKYKGIDFVNEPLTSPDGKARVAFCKDPDGTWLELVEELK